MIKKKFQVSIKEKENNWFKILLKKMFKNDCSQRNARTLNISSLKYITIQSIYLLMLKMFCLLNYNNFLAE